MVSTNRYNGLKYLVKLGLPVRPFLKIEQLSNNKEEFVKEIPPFGWTIRTCKKDGKREFNLFYKNNISLSELKEILRDRLSKVDNEFYIIYHSWDFDFSFNIVKSNNEYIVEGNFGSQKNISIGVGSPMFSIKINAKNFSNQQSFLEEPPLKIKHGFLRALRMLNSNVYLNNYYTEVAITKQKQMFFYEFTNIDSL